MHGAAGSIEMRPTEHYRKDFLNYLNGTLSDQARVEFEASLEESKELQAELDNYRRVIQMEKETAKEKFELDERFVSKVMAEIKHNQSLFSKILMEIRSPGRKFSAAIGGFAVIALCLSLAYGPAYEEYKHRIATLDPAVLDSADQELPLSTSIESEQTLRATEVPHDRYSSGQDVDLPKAKEAPVPTVEVHKTLPEHLSHVSPELLDPYDPKLGTGRSISVDNLMGTPRTQQEPAPSRSGQITMDELRGTSRSVEGYIRPGYPPSTLRGNKAFPEGYLHMLTSAGEGYGQLGENPPILTSSEPMSTFTIDVDTESYTNTRRFLQQGQLPPSAAVRIEEFLNYFDYDYPSQGNQPFTTNLEVAPSPGYEGAHLLKIGIKARESLSRADVKLQIEFNPEHVVQYRLIGYENRALSNQDFANDSVKAGEIGAGHTVTALYEIVLTGSKAAEELSPMYRDKQEEKVEKKPESSFSDELAFLKISYKQPEGSKSAQLTFPLSHSNVKNDLSQASDDFLFAAAVSAFAHKLRESQYAPDMTFDQIVALATKSKGQDKKGFRQEFIELVKNANAINRR